MPITTRPLSPEDGTVAATIFFDAVTGHIPQLTTEASLKAKPFIAG